MPNRLLLADEDLKTSRVLEVNLRGAGFEVTTVTSGAAAWVAIEQQLPEVIIAAIDLAVIDGFELCARVRAREGGREVAFIFLGDDDSLAHRIKSIEVGADDYLLKPPYVQEVVARVRSLVQRRDRQSLTSSARAAEAFAGRLSDLSVVDLLQIIDSSRRSGIVHLHGARESPATIYFRQGHVVDAEVGRLSGVNAISRLFSWTEGTFEVEWKPIRRPNAIGLPTPELVLEGMKRLDERNRLAGGLPDLNDVFEVNYRVLAERLSEIPDEVNAVLRLFDGARTLAHVVEDCQLPDLEAMAIAIRLREEGIIHNVSPPGPAEKTTPPVGPRSSAPPPGADDVTVVRRITAVGIGSNPVQQSFAERLGATASAPTTVDAPAPEPPPMDAGDDDELTPPPHHAKTDPGLGRPLDLLEREVTAPASEAIPEPPRDEPDGPGMVPSSPDPAATRSLGRGSDIQRRLTEPVAPLGPSSDAAFAPETATPREADPSTLRTQRGIGPFPELLNARAAAAMPSVHEEAEAPPIVAPEAARPPAALSTPAARAGAVAAEMDAEATAPSARAATPPPMVSLEHDISGAGAGASPAAPTDEAPPEVPRVAEPARPSASPEKTMRMNFPDEEFSAQDALDELGVPGWKRGARIVAAVVATGALAAVLVHHFRGGAAGSIKEAASADRAPAPEHPAAVAPGPAPVAQAPGSAPAPVPKAPDVTPAPPAAAPPPPSQATAPEGAPAAPSPGATTPSAAPAEKIAEKVAAPAAAAEKPPSPGAEKPTPPKAAEARPRNGAAEPGPTGDAKPAASESPMPAAPPADFASQLASCRSQFLRSRIRDAAVTCAAAVDANPNSADALTMMAHVELNRGRLAHANELAEKSIAIDPNQADAYVIIGGVHQDSGRNAQAKVAYRRYLQLAPHGRYAEELRSIVGSL